MGKRMYEVNITKRINKDNLVVLAEELKSKKPIPSAPAWFQSFVTNEFKPLVTKVVSLEKDVADIKLRLDKQDALNQTFIDYMKKQDTLNQTFIDYMKKQDTLNQTFIDYMKKQDTMNEMFIGYMKKQDTLNDNLVSYLRKQDTLNQTFIDYMHSHH